MFKKALLRFWLLDLSSLRYSRRYMKHGRVAGSSRERRLVDARQDAENDLSPSVDFIVGTRTRNGDQG